MSKSSHVSLGDPSKDLRLVQLLEKEIQLKKAKFDDDGASDADAKQEIINKIDDLVGKCNALGIHYASLSVPNFPVGRKLYITAEALLNDSSSFRQFFPTDINRLKLLSITYQNLGTLEKIADQLQLAVDYHTKAIEIEMQLKDLKEQDFKSASHSLLHPSPAVTKKYVPRNPTESPNLKSIATSEFSQMDSVALLQSCISGQEETSLRISRSKKIDLTLCDGGNNSILHHACQQKLTLVVQELCGMKADVNAVNNALNTPLHFAASSALETTRILINAGAKINSLDATRSTALHYACLAGLSDVALFLLQHGAVFDSRNQSNNTPLHYAVSSNMPEVVKQLLQMSADVDARDAEENTPLHYACSLRLANMALLLLQYNSNLDFVNRSGNTALLYACSNSLEDVALQILKKGAIASHYDVMGNTALHYACANQLQAVVSSLIQRGEGVVDYEAPNLKGNTPLHYACSSNNLLIVQLLVQKGVYLNPQDQSLNTPLHYACLHEDPVVAEFLIEQGADMNLRNNEGRTPVDYAVVTA